MRVVLFVGFFGAIGAVSRFGMDRFFSSFVATEVPVATLLANVSGSFLMGVLYVLGAERNFLPADVSLALGVGFLGSFTTFSSYSVQTLLLVEQRSYALAVGYFLLSPLLGLCAAWLGASSVRFIGA